MKGFRCVKSIIIDFQLSDEFYRYISNLSILTYFTICQNEMSTEKH